MILLFVNVNGKIKGPFAIMNPDVFKRIVEPKPVQTGATGAHISYATWDVLSESYNWKIQKGEVFFDNDWYNFENWP